MQGKWIVIYDEDGGRAKERNNGVVIKFSDKRMTVYLNNKVENRFTFRLHPNKKLPALDLKGNGQLYLGIYRFDVDRLIICASEKARPIDYKFGLKHGAILILKRWNPRECQ